MVALGGNMSSKVLANVTEMSGSNSTFSQSFPFELHLWPAGIIFLIGGTAAVFGNVMIMAAIFVSPELRRNRCNALVGNLACCDAVSGLYVAVAGVHGLLTTVYGPDVTAMPQYVCYFVDIPVTTSWDAGALTILAIGVDRAMSLWRPIFYKNLSTKYVIVINGGCWLFGIALTVLGYFYTTRDEMVPICIMPAARRGAAFAVWNNSNIVMNILVIVAYAVAYYKAKQLAKVASTNSDQILRKNRLLTSLLICVYIYIVCWVVAICIVLLVNVSGMPPSAVFHCMVYVGVGPTINIGCNFFVYYVRSDEYRRAFKKIMGYETKSSSVAPSIVQVSPSPAAASSQVRVFFPNK